MEFIASLTAASNPAESYLPGAGEMDLPAQIIMVLIVHLL